MDGKPDKRVGNLVGVIALVVAEGRHLPLTYNTQHPARNLRRCGSSPLWCPRVAS